MTELSDKFSQAQNTKLISMIIAMNEELEILQSIFNIHFERLHSIKNLLRIFLILFNPKRNLQFI